MAGLDGNRQPAGTERPATGGTEAPDIDHVALRAWRRDRVRKHLCVESFIGDAAGGEGVKLEEQILVTEDGIEPLSRFPFEPALLA